MNNIRRILAKELKSYFISPIAYIVMAIFLLVTGWFFFSTFFLYNQASLRHFFSLLPIILSFIIPAVTMRLFSEELHVGSYEILMTMPVTANEVIIGKFLAAVAFVAILLLPTLSYAVTIALLGPLDPGPVIGGYVGALFLGALFSAIGLLASAMTRNQIIAFIIGTGICFALTLIDKMLFFLPAPLLGVLENIGADFHFQNIARGIIDSRDILFFASSSFLALFGANLVLQGKK
jgi:ABC-2 type transport system permease protein